MTSQDILIINTRINRDILENNVIFVTHKEQCKKKKKETFSQLKLKRTSAVNVVLSSVHLLSAKSTQRLIAQDVYNVISGLKTRQSLHNMKETQNHDNSPLKTTSEAPGVKCGQCGKGFIDNTMLDKHVSEEHNYKQHKKDYQCSL